MFKKSKTNRMPTLTEEKFIFKGGIDIISKEQVKKGIGQYSLVGSFARISDEWTHNRMINMWDSDFSSYTVSGYDNIWESVVHDEDIPKEERGARLRVSCTLPNGRIDVGKYIGRDENFVNKVIKVYEILLDDIKKYNKEFCSSTENTSNENVENEEKLNTYLREEVGLNNYHFFCWKLEDLGITHISPATYSDGKRKSDDIHMTFVSKISDDDKIVDENLTPFKPSSLGEFNVALNEYRNNLSDLKVLAAIHKWFTVQINHKSEEDTIFKEVFNIE